MSEDSFARLARRSWQLLGVAAAAVVIALAASRLRIVVLPVILALFAASLLIGPSQWLHRRGLPRALAALAAMLAATLALLGTGALVAPAVVDELDNVGTSVQQGVGEVLELHPVAILLALPAGAVLAGVAGAFLAVPAAAVVWTVVTTVREHRSVRADRAPGT